MVEASVAKVYARALFNLSRDRGRVEEWGEELRLVNGLLRESKNLRVFFLAPGITAAEKEKILKMISEMGKLKAEMTNFLRIMVFKRRINLLPQVVREYRQLVDFFLGQMDVWVRSAAELSPDEKNKLEKVLAGRLRQKVRIEYRLDPDLIGGMVVKAGEKVYDGSILRQLDAIRKRMMEG